VKGAFNLVFEEKNNHTTTTQIIVIIIKLIRVRFKILVFGVDFHMTEICLFCFPFKF